jgi:hypothetical protein
MTRKIAIALATAAALSTTTTAQKGKAVEWPAYGGDHGGMKYSTLAPA